MKTLRILLFFIAIAFTSRAQIPNASFESWYNYSLGQYPTGWMTSDSVAAAIPGGSNNVYSGTDFYDGALSMHLKSVTNAIGLKGPGIATNGKVALVGSTFVFSGGTADTNRARFLSGEFKYTPTNINDQGFISIVMTWDSLGTKDTIATGKTFFSGNVSTYTAFNTILEYRDYRNHPDTFLIIIQSSLGINDPNLGVGTELVIDSLNFSGFVGIEEATDVIKSVNVYPSPAQNQLNVAVELKKKIDLNCSIYDLTGKLVLQSSMKSDKETIDISSLSKGNYILKLSDENKKALYSKNFIKE